MKLAEFEGAWRLNREIEDFRAVETGHLTGTAQFVSDGQGLDYTETGLLHLSGRPPMSATRRYLWRQSGSDIAVLFEDGRYFHRIDGAEDTHLCGDDFYRVMYDFSAFPRWSSLWQVRGPRKHYQLRSFYTRA